jgi:hypothetical protein
MTTTTMSYSILNKTKDIIFVMFKCIGLKKPKPILVIFELFIGWKGVETMDAIYWVNCRYKIIIYRHIEGNNISVIENNTFNNLPSLSFM